MVHGVVAVDTGVLRGLRLAQLLDQAEGQHHDGRDQQQEDAEAEPAGLDVLGCGHRVGPGSAVYAATKFAVRALSEGLRQEVKPHNIRTTVISPGAVATELPNTITDPDVAATVDKLYEDVAVPADSFARAVVFALSQPEEVDINEILFRPTRQAS